MWSQASYCHLNQISISTACDSAAAALPLSSSLLNFGLFLCPCFPNLPMCVFRLRTLFIQSNETSRPDGGWIIMSFIFKSTALSSQWPNQFKYSPKLQPTHTAAHPTQEDGEEYSHTMFTCFFNKHAEDIGLSTPR